MIVIKIKKKINREQYPKIRIIKQKPSTRRFESLSPVLASQSVNPTRYVSVYYPSRPLARFLSYSQHTGRGEPTLARDSITPPFDVPPSAGHVKLYLVSKPLDAYSARAAQFRGCR